MLQHVRVWDRDVVFSAKRSQKSYQMHRGVLLAYCDNVQEREHENELRA